MTLARELIKAHTEREVAEAAVLSLEAKVARITNDINDLQVDLTEATENLAAWRERLAVRQAECSRLEEVPREEGS